MRRMVEPAADAAVHDLAVDGITHGAEGVARLPSGKVCFVPFAAPGETVRVEVVEERRRWSRGRLLEVLQPSPDRVAPPCPYAGPWPAAGEPTCGGCALQYLAPARQRELKRRIVTEQLQRIAGLADPPVAETVPTGPDAYRSRARFGVDEQGRLGFRAHRSHQVRAIDRCLLLTAGAQRLRDEIGDGWNGAAEISVHAGAQGGGALVRAGAGGLPPLPGGELPVAVVDRGAPMPLRGDPAAVEHVGDLRLRVSPGSFFQAGPQAAEALVEQVLAAAGDVAGRHAVDAYAGVGLFAAALADAGARVTAIEQHRGSVADARHNLADRDATVVRADIAQAAADGPPGAPADVVVIDPPREGAGPATCRQLAGWHPQRLVYVSCDPAALARDTGALVDAGYQLARAVPVDCFPHTAAIEVVARFEPAGR